VQEEKLKGFSGFVRYLNVCSEASSSSKCRYDIGIGGWASSSERFAMVHMVATIANNDYRVITRIALATGSSLNNFVFFSKFAWSVYLALFGLFVRYVFVTALDPGIMALEADSKCSIQECRLGASLEMLLLKNKALLKLRHAFFDSAYHLLGQVSWAAKGNYCEPSQA
jgi:hypothetical protein